MASAENLFVKSFTLGRDWKCRNCEAEVPAMQEHGVDQGCQNPQPIYEPSPDPIQVAVAAERERCAKIAEGCAMTRPSFIGPLHGTGWNAAVEQIAAKIREGK